MAAYTLNAPGAGAWIPVCGMKGPNFTIQAAPYGLQPSMLVAVLNGFTGTYNLEATGDEPDPITGNTSNMGAVPMQGLSGLTGVIDAGLAYACTYVRCNLLTVSAGSIRFMYTPVLLVNQLF